jgi:hypothetical protein
VLFVRIIKSLLIYLQVAAHYTVVGSKVAADYAATGAQTAGHYTWLAGKHGAIYTYHGATVVADHTARFAGLTWKYAWIAGETGASWLMVAGKVGAEYAVKGSVYTYQHGTVALKDGSVHFYHYSIYFVTNFREASVEAAIWMWRTLQTVAMATASGSYTGGVFLIHATGDFLIKSYEVAVVVCEWTCVTATETADWTINAATTSAQFIKASAVSGYNIAVATVVGGCDVAVMTATSAYAGGIRLTEWIVDGAVLSWRWLSAAISGTSQFLYVAVNQYGLRWLGAVGNVLVEGACVLGRILSKFFGDLGVYLANFVYVTVTRVASVLSIVAAFVYHIATAIGSVIRVILGAAVFCTTRVFTAVIWFLRETVFAYLYMLHQYNMYRELLFLVFIGLLTVYCSGLLRDRRRLDETDLSDSSGDEDDVAGDEQMENDAVGKPSPEVSLKELALSTEHHVMPGHDEVDSPDEDLAEVGIPEHGEENEELELREEDLLPDDCDLPEYVENVQTTDHQTSS